jgi:hypothetical protein
MVLQLISIAGIILAACFPTDPVTTPADALTESGKLHMMGASLDWTPFAALFISLSLARTSSWVTVKKRLLLTSALTIVLTILFIVSVSMAPNGQFGPGTYAGMIGRFLFVSYLGWILAVGLHVRALTKADSSNPSDIPAPTI